MRISSKPKMRRSSVPYEEPSWDNWNLQQHQSTPSQTLNGTSLSRRSGTNQPSRRSILRNVDLSSSDRPELKPITRTCIGSIPFAGETSPTNDGQDQFLLPTSRSRGSITEGHPARNNERDLLPASTSFSYLDARPHTTTVPRCSDAEADRLARACGDGPFSPIAPSPYLETSIFTDASPRLRSRSVSNTRGQRRSSPSLASSGARRSGQLAPPFPHPPKPQAIKALKSILTEETKSFKIHDYVEVEELMSGNMWEDEDELPVDCVRDKADDDSGHDGVWRRERRERRLMERVNRDIRRRDGSVFGSYVQDLPDCAMVPVVIGGYRHHVPEVVHACTDELYKTGIYHHDLFRTLPNRTRLLHLVAYFDNPQHCAQLPSRPSLPNLPSLPPSTKPRLPLHRESYSEVCALLVTYLTSLPKPLVHRSLVDALWAWCVSPSIIRAEQRQRRHGDDDASESSSSDSDLDDDTPNYSARLRKREEALLNLPSLRVQIAIARQVLLLLPRRYFSILACLLTFFATLQVCPENGLTPEDVGRIFGGVIVGGRTPKKELAQSRSASSGGDATTDERGGERQEERGSVRDIREKDDKGQRIVAWLVKHWEQISTAYEAESEERFGRWRSHLASLSRNGTQEDVQRTRSRSCSMVDPGNGESRHTFAQQERQSIRQPQRQSVDWRDRNRPTAAFRDKDEQSPRPGMKHRQAFVDREGEKKRRMSMSAPSTESSEPDDRDILLSPLDSNSMTRQSRPSAIPVRQREESFPPRQDRAALGLKSLVPQQINIPEEAVDAELFATPAPFDLAVDGADDVSIYSTASMDEVHHMYSSSLLHETLPTLERSLEVVFADTPPVPPLHWSKHQDVRGLGAADASAMSRAVLRQENAELRKRLEEALGERDQARKVLNAMRGLVGSQAMLDST